MWEQAFPECPRLPPTVADTIQKAVTRLVFGDLSKIGLRQMRTGVYSGIDCIRGSEVTFSDGRKNEFDAIVAAIGYERTYADFLPALDAERVLDWPDGGV